MNSRMEQLNEALTLLDFLHDAGLLEITSADWPDFLKMNELIRSMAVQIMDETQQRAMIKNCMSLKDLPDEKSWTEDLVRVTLESNQIENIPCNFSPSCSNLSTLVLSRNYELRCIGDSFFEGMPRLKVLDLSYTGIESLPPSIFGLVNLTALLLHMCVELKNIPSMAELKSLKKLDLSCSGLQKVPEDIECLSKLTYLDLLYTRIMEFDSEILAKLSHLQFLRLNEYCAVNGEAVARLVRLETLHCSFNDVVELNKYLVHLKGGGFTEREPPLQLYVKVGRGVSFQFTRANDFLYDGEDPFAERDNDWSSVGLDNWDINKTDLLNYFQDIVIQKCHGARSLCKFSPIKGKTELKHFSIQECKGLEFLCSLSSVTGQSVLENVEYMDLLFLDKLGVLVRKERDVGYGHSCFSNLTRFVIKGCPSMKRLFPINLMPNLKKLKRLYVLDCRLMEEIFGAEEEEEEESKNIVEKKRYCLPKLSILLLADLPRLKRFCGGGTICVLSKHCTIKLYMCQTTVFADGVAFDDMAQH